MPTPIREKIATNAQPYLRPGEQVQGAFAGQSISGWWSLLTYLMFFWLRYRSVIVTDQRILMLDTGKWSMTKPKGVVAELPRNVVIGPPSGLWWKCLTLGEKLFVHRRFHKDVVASDTLLAQSGMPVQEIPLGGHKAPQAGRYAAPPAPQGQPQAPHQGQPKAQQWEQQGQPQAPQQPQQWQQQAPAQSPQQAPQQSQPYAPPAQPGQYAAPAQPSPQDAPQQPQQWQPPAPNPALSEPDDDNRTRIRRVEPRPEQGESGQ